MHISDKKKKIGYWSSHGGKMHFTQGFSILHRDLSVKYTYF